MFNIIKDCLLYSIVAILEYFGHIAENLHESNIIAAIRDYLYEENGIHFMGSSLTLAKGSAYSRGLHGF